MIYNPLNKIHEISKIKAPEIIDEPYQKVYEDLVESISENVHKLEVEINTVITYSLIGPMAVLSLLRSYDYLIVYKELGYLETLNILA